MIDRKEIQEIVNGYSGVLTIGMIGSHSALEVGAAAKTHGFRTMVFVEEGRDSTYSEFNSHLYDKIVPLKKFRDIANPKNQELMRAHNVIFLPNRSFSVYLKKKGAENEYETIENEFKVPMYGNRHILRAEDRKDEKGQYYLLEKAGVRIPIQIKKPEQIDRPVIVKVQQAGNELERAFFYAISAEDFYKKAEEMLAKKVIDEAGLKKARIEEYVLGPRFNANFHAYALKDIFGNFDFVGFSDRIQVNLQGFRNLTAMDQLKLQDIPVKNEEIGHFGITMRESKRQEIYETAKKFFSSDVLLQTYPPGIIGLCGIQGAIQYSPLDNKTLEFVVFDLSPRIPGDPAMGPTSPEMRSLTLKMRANRQVKNHFGDVVVDDPVDLSMIEIEFANREGRLEEIVT